MTKRNKRWLFLAIFTIAAFLISRIGLQLWSSNAYNTIEKPIDIIIIPGYPYNGNKMDPILMKRLLWAKHLLDVKKGSALILSGSAVYSPFQEAEVMVDFLKQEGINEEILRIETKAKHTIENLVYGYNLAKKSGFSSIGFASDYIQIIFIKLFAPPKILADIKLLPIDYSKIKNVDSFIKNYTSAIKPKNKETFISLKSYESWYQRIQGTFGKNLDPTIYSE